MFDLSHQTLQTYTYEDRKELEDLLKSEEIHQHATFYDNEKIVQILLNRNEYIRLSDLLYWIKLKFVYFNVGQLLHLCDCLITKVYHQQCQKINHQYLSPDRIWLKLTSASPPLSIYYTRIKYNIIFTGYQCPLYEKGNVIPATNAAIFEIVESIMEFSKDLRSNQEIQQAFNSLNLQQCHEQIKILKNQLKYNDEKQTTVFDKQNIDKKSQKRTEKIKKIMTEQVINRNDNQLLKEWKVIEFVKQISKIDDQKKLKNFEYSQELANLWSKQFEDSENLFFNEIKDQISKALKLLIQQKQINFKFEVSQTELSEYEEEIFIIIKQKKIFKYFQNSAWFQMAEKFDYESVLVVIFSKIYYSAVKEYTESIFSTFLLTLLAELI